MSNWRTRNRPLVIVLTVVLLGLMLFPFFVMMSTMLKASQEIYVVPATWIPRNITFHNFTRVWREYHLLDYFRSSLIVALGTMGLNILVSVPAAYAVARLRFFGRKSVMYLLLAIQMFSPVIVVISLFRIFARAQLIDTYTGLILANTVFTISFATWMMTGYFSAIPTEIEEAARIDGCSRVGTLLRVMLPVAAPGLVTVMIYNFITAWNEFLFALTFINARSKMPLTLGIYQFVGRWSTQWELLTTSAFLALIPVLVLFYLIEKQLVAGLASGAVKG
ncbi:MAG: carbohydrate ABC transporter permease [Spirochaetaceae bacterium]|nr:MAG: carbohydrate ABC transporter permease [Spirochaetaceae bacterium]